MQQKDTAKPLWEERFLVKVPQLSLRSVEDIKMYGSYCTMYKDIDKDMTQSWSQVYLTIARMVELHTEGSPIAVVDKNDTKIIYELISDHLQAWKNQLHYGINVGNAPLEDLINMDKFANLVYEHAKYQFTPETIKSALAEGMTSVMPFNHLNFFKKPIARTREEMDEMKKAEATPQGQLYPERESMTGYLQSRVVGDRPIGRFNI